MFTRPAARSVFATSSGGGPVAWVVELGEPVAHGSPGPSANTRVASRKGVRVAVRGHVTPAAYLLGEAGTETEEERLPLLKCTR